MFSGVSEFLSLRKDEQPPKIVITPAFMPIYGKDVMNSLELGTRDLRKL